MYLLLKNFLSFFFAVSSSSHTVSLFFCTHTHIPTIKIFITKTSFKHFINTFCIGSKYILCVIYTHEKTCVLFKYKMYFI